MADETRDDRPLDREAASLGRTLASLRKKKGLTQAELANALGVSQSTITDWERGKTRPRPKLMLQLDTALGSYLRYDAARANPAPAELPDILSSRRPELDFKVNADAFDYICQRIEVFERYYEADLSRTDFARIAAGTWAGMFADPDRHQPTASQWVDNSIIGKLTQLVEAQERQRTGSPPNPYLYISRD